MGKKTWIAGFGTAAVATLALLGTSAHAGGASIHLNIGAPGYVYTQPAYVYSQPSYVYTQPGYVQYGQHHGHHYNRGWRGRDRDHDGVPNRFDRDRDNDGVPNRFDRRPNNPYRY